MIRSLFLATLFILSAKASQQLVVVISPDFNSSHAQMMRYEQNGTRFMKVGVATKVNLGRNGLGWGKGIMNFNTNASQPHKHEGDGKAPAGVFRLSKVFGYAKSYPATLPYMYTSDDLICVDDTTDSRYNKLLHVMPDALPKSFERMHRDDDQYELGIVVEHNPKNTPKAGSCIFMHVQKAQNTPTAGCTSMEKKDISTLIAWLDAAKEPLLIQLPISYCAEAAKYFKGIECLNTH